jgi:hypothetical protein
MIDLLFDSSVFGSFDAPVECCAIGWRDFLLAQEFGGSDLNQASPVSELMRA